MRRAFSIGGIVAVTVMLVSGAALADAGDRNDVRALEQQLSDEHAALSTADCNAACRALMSIRRAADKICALEPGPRCDSARAKAADATQRVRDACPDCVIAAAPPQPSPTPPPERAAAPDTVRTASAPPEAEAKGGCRSCATTDATGPGGDVGLIVLGVLAAVRLVGRRSKKDRRDL